MLDLSDVCFFALATANAIAPGSVTPARFISSRISLVSSSIFPPPFLKFLMLSCAIIIPHPHREKNLYIFYRQFIDFPPASLMIRRIRQPGYVPQRLFRSVRFFERKNNAFYVREIRYGLPRKCLVIVGLIAMLTAGWTDSLMLVTLSWALIIYAYFRMFSRNIYKRSAENQWYLDKTYKLRLFFARQKNMMTAAQDPSHLQMSGLQTKNPDSPREGTYRDPLSKMQRHIY